MPCASRHRGSAVSHLNLTKLIRIMSQKPPEKSARQAMLSGSFWTVSMRWSIKLLGFISTAILARILQPSEYAVIAMAYLVIGLLDSFFDFGVEVALIRKQDVDEVFINSAWSMRVIEGVGIGTLLIVLSPLATLYFKDARVAPVLWALALCIALNGSSNIGIMLARKSLNFSLEFKVQLIAKVAQLIVTIATTYYLRDYRGLLIGIMTSYVTSWFVSYLLHSYRPRWNSSGFKEIWAVTRWLVLSNVVRYLVNKADGLAAGRIGTSTQFGSYNVGADLGQLPTGEVGPAILKAFFPVLSSLQHDAPRVKSGVLKVMAIVNSITLPAGLGLAAVSTPITLLMLGPNWSSAIPFVKIFGLVGAVQVAGQPLATLLTMRGFTKTLSGIVWIEAVVFVVACLLLVPTMHLEGLAFARLCSAVGSFLMLSFKSSRHCDLPMRHVATSLWRPLFSAAIMYFVASFVLITFLSSVWAMASAILAGATCYVLLMLCSWHLVGRPAGLEQEIMHILKNRRLLHT